MEIDLDQHAARAEPFRSRVCVIGGGIAGLTLAHRLTQQGIDVALLEAGGHTLDQQHLLTAPLAGEPHIGTHEGRFRAFGGASLRWGGQLLPFPADPPNSWPIAPSNLAPFYPEAEKILAVDDLPYAAAPFFAAASAATPALLQQLPLLDARLSKWTPFSHRNMAHTIGRDLLHHSRAKVYLHAQATELLLAPTRDRIVAVLVRTLAGATFRFEAEAIILAAGAVETARLLLASRSVAPEGVGNAHDQVGRNFHDHLTLPAATITGPARSMLLDQLRPWVFGNTQHSIKFEASTQLRKQLNLNPVLAHITLEEPEGSGLGIVRDILTSRQRGNSVSTLANHAAKLPTALVEALHLALEAKLHHRRFVAKSTALTLRLNAAQDAPSTSRITLSDNLDPFGLPLPLVDWRISPNELQTLRSFATHLRQRFDSIGLQQAAWLPEFFLPNAPLPLEDARHAMGGACMGHDPQTSVVDENLQVHGLANLYVAGPSVFPDGSPQLPTLTMMALTLRLASRLNS